MRKSNEDMMEDVKELISWHQKACIELAHDMSQDNHAQMVAARLAIINLFKNIIGEDK